MYVELTSVVFKDTHTIVEKKEVMTKLNRKGKIHKVSFPRSCLNKPGLRRISHTIEKIMMISKGSEGILISKLSASETSTEKGRRIASTINK